MKSAKGLLLFVAAAAVAGALPASASDRMTWAGSAYGGFAKITEDGAPGGSIGMRGNMFAMVKPTIGIGGELGYHLFGSQDFSIYDSGTGDTFSGSDKWSAFQATAQMMARGTTGTTHPFGTFGLGLYSVKEKLSGQTTDSGGNPVGSPTELSATVSKLGFNLGAGVQFRGSNSLGFGIEGRWHSAMNVLPDKTTGEPEQRSLNVVTIMAGVNFN